MRGFRSGDRGQAGIALIIVIAWALSAVLVLTRTLVAAQEINNKVTDITSKLAGAKGDTSYVAQLNQTENTANQILSARVNHGSNIAYAAHIGGFVIGVVVALLVRIMFASGRRAS